MQIGILSDTHGRHDTVQKALDLLQERHIDFVLHCGDIDDTETVQLFRGFTTHFVFGNCDWDKPALRQAIEDTGATLHEPFGDLALDGVRIAWTHGDDKNLFHDLRRSGQFNYLFYGHTHQAEQHESGETLVVNPGALHRARAKTFVVLDLDTERLASVVVD